MKTGKSTIQALAEIGKELANERGKTHGIQAHINRVIRQIRESSPDSAKHHILQNKLRQLHKRLQQSNKVQKVLQTKISSHVSDAGGGQDGKKHRKIRTLHVEREISSEIRSQLRMLKEFGKPEIEFGDRSNDFVQSDSYDLFISHASEDKDEFVRPLATALIALGMRVWYDEFALTIGDSLRESIDLGLSKSAYGLVILSPSFLAKHWTKYEFNGFVSREMEGTKVILPIWHRITKEEVLRFSPTLVDKVALNSANLGIDEIAAELNAAVRKKRAQLK